MSKLFPLFVQDARKSDLSSLEEELWDAVPDSKPEFKSELKYDLRLKVYNAKSRYMKSYPLEIKGLKIPLDFKTRALSFLTQFWSTHAEADGTSFPWRHGSHSHHFPKAVSSKKYRKSIDSHQLQGLLADLSAFLPSGLPEPELFGSFLKRMAQGLGMTCGEILKLSKEPNEVPIVMASFGWEEKEINHLQSKQLNNRLLAALTAADQPMLFEGKALSEYFNSFPNPLINSNVYALIYSHQQPVGILGLHSPAICNFSAKEHQFVQTAANILSLLAERQQQESALQNYLFLERRNLERERLLRRIVEITNHSLDLSQILETTVSELGATLGVDHCIILPSVDGDRLFKRNDDRDTRTYPQYCRSQDVPFSKWDGFPLHLASMLPTNLPAGQMMRLLYFFNPEDYMEHLFSQIGENAEAARHPAGEVSNNQLTQFYRLIAEYRAISLLQFGIYFHGVHYGTVFIHQFESPVESKVESEENFENRVQTRLNRKSWHDDEIKLIQEIATHLGGAFYQAALFFQEYQAREQLELSHQQLKVYIEKLEQSNQELDHFAMVASHDLQAPLRRIQIFGDTLEKATRGKLEQEALDSLHRMQRAAGKMQALITDLLSWSRINRKGQPFKPVHLEDVIQNTLADLEPKISETQAHIAMGNMIWLDGDRRQIQQLFSHLIENSLKFRRPEIKPVIKIDSAIIEGSCCQIIVEDNGIGFVDEYHERIFEVFERLHCDEKYPGTGIGLAICKRIVQRHGGVIYAEGDPDHGARFIIRLPTTQRK